ncbi:MAG TPA: TetR family transcriptional regulator [Rhizomicrobium sp.]
MTRAALAEQRSLRRAQAHAATRDAILEAARRVAARDGAREMSLRGVAAEAGFAPAALYGYFSRQDELLLALAAEDLSLLARAMRAATARPDGTGRLASASAAALSSLRETESLAAALAAMPAQAGSSEAERLFNGRLIAVLKVLSESSGNRAATRAGQCDVVLMAAAVAGLALFARSGRLDALGFNADELAQRLEAHFALPR